MAVTFNFELNKKPSKQGRYKIYIRITQDRKHRKIPTTIELFDKEHWQTKRQRISSKEPLAEKWNSILDEEMEKIKSTYRDLKKEGRGNANSVVNASKQEDMVFSFIEYAENYAKDTMESGNSSTAEKYITFINKLKFFINGVSAQKVVEVSSYNSEKYGKFISTLKRDLLFNEITLSFLNRFKKYMQKCPIIKKPGQTLHPNTIAKQFDIFKSIFNKGRTELREYGLFLKDNPFDNFSYDTIETNKEKLTFEELEKINQLELEENSLLWHTRNCFMLSFYCAGVRAGDMIQLRGTNIVYANGGWRISYRMNKTERIKEILLVDEALRIVKKYVDLQNRTTDYIFPLLDNNAVYAKAITWEDRIRLAAEIRKQLAKTVNSKNSLLNKYLQKIATMAGIDKKVSMHIARHSFANIARQKKANVYDISKALGHSSLSITEAYLSKFDVESQDATIKQVFKNEKRTPSNEDLLEALKKMSSEEIKVLMEKLNLNQK